MIGAALHVFLILHSKETPNRLKPLRLKLFHPFVLTGTI
jgi:hypothetical protein